MVRGVQVRDVERLLADVQRLTRTGYWEWDVAANAITWSDELYELFGVTPESFDATYEGYLNLVHPDDRGGLNDVVQRAYATGLDYAVEHRVVQPGGEVRWVLGRGTVELDAEGAPERLFGVAVDITDRKRSEEVLREFIANAAHELRTPVASMTSAVGLLLDGGVQDANERAEVLAVVERQVERMRHLSEALLDLTTLEQRTTSLLLMPLSLQPVLDRAMARAGTPAVVADVADEAAVLADADELETVLHELLANARDHGGDTIVVRARRDRDQIVIEVEDDGAGVSRDRRAAMFSPFSRSRQLRTGPGLGLALVRRLLTMMGGSIEYRDRPAGGARFVVRLGAVR